MKKSILFLSSLLLIACGGGNKDEGKKRQMDEISKGDLTSDEMNDLFEREKQNAERAKHSGSGINIVTISDLAQVSALKKEIEEKISRKKKEKIETDEKDSGPVKKFKNGDASQVKKIIAILNGSDEKEKRSLYFDLQKKYDDAPTYSLKDPDLVKTILSKVNDAGDEKDAIQLAGFMKLPGYQKVFEERLLSGKSKDVGRLCYWLAQVGQSTKTLDFVSTQIYSKKIDLEKEQWIMSGISDFAEKGNEANRKKAVSICRDVLTKNMVSREKIEELKKYYSSANPAGEALRTIMRYGDKSDVTLIANYFKQGIMEDEALQALVRLEGEARKSDVVNYLHKTDRKFFIGLNAAEILYKQKKDEALCAEILKSFAAKKGNDKYDSERLVRTFMNMGAQEEIKHCGKYISDEKLCASLKKTLTRNSMSLQAIADDAFAMGLLEKKFDVNTLKKNEEFPEESNDPDIPSLLDAAGIYLWFDAETGFVPVGYDELIMDYVKRSKGKMKDALVWMDAKENNGGETFEYKITLIFNNRAYVIEPEDIGDWYNVEAVTEMMNKALEDAGMAERFVFVDTGDQTVQIIFGEEAKVNAFVAKYEM